MSEFIPVSDFYGYEDRISNIKSYKVGDIYTLKLGDDILKARITEIIEDGLKLEEINDNPNT